MAVIWCFRFVNSKSSFDVNIRKICCQACGADLQIHEGIRYVTCNYCNARLEVVCNDSVTHTRLLDQIEKTTQSMAGNLKVIELQNDLERLDREWQMEREKWLIRGKNGNLYEPSETSHVFGGFMAVCMGIGVMSFSTIGSTSIFFSLFGLVFGLVFVGMGLNSIVRGGDKASGYKSVLQTYEQRRSMLIQRIESERNPT